MIDDFMSNRLATTLARSVRRQIRDVREHDNAIDVETLRAVEPAVVRWLTGDEAPSACVIGTGRLHV